MKIDTYFNSKNCKDTNLALFTKELSRLQAIDGKMDVWTFNERGLTIEFNIKDSWYVGECQDNEWTLQENLDNGDIRYVIDRTTFRKFLNQVKKVHDNNKNQHNV